jgi:DNA-binding NarL/FixJ family response regulator
VGSILVCDDERSICELLDIALRRDGHKVETVTSGEAARRKIESALFDVIVTDIKMPNVDGVEATRRIVAQYPGVKVLVLTTFDADSHVIQALRAGASGYLLKDSQPSAVVSSILAVMVNERVLASSVVSRVLDMLTGTGTPKQYYDGLTAREVEILKLIATGQSNKQVARRLEISEKTVRNHVSHMYEKLQIYDRSQAVLYAVRKGLIEL